MRGALQSGDVDLWGEDPTLKFVQPACSSACKSSAGAFCRGHSLSSMQWPGCLVTPCP